MDNSGACGRWRGNVLNDVLLTARDRRGVLRTGLGVAAAIALPSALSAAGRIQLEGMKNPAPVPARPLTSSRVVRPELLRRAVAALDAHGGRIAHRDRIAIADFSAPSAQPRFHLINLGDGSSTSMLVAHGSGSDPSHSGWVKRFSNDPGSNASCEGAFVTQDYYVGKHGRSQRLVGLDATNNNALSRAIVVHAAWYSNPDMLRTHGMLGRSQGCFAVGDADLPRLFDRLGPGRMIYAAKV
jgi:hypothetical protein